MELTCAPQIFDPVRTDRVAGPSPNGGVIASDRCRVACITDICRRLRRRDRVIADYRKSVALVLSSRVFHSGMAARLSLTCQYPDLCDYLERFHNPRMRRRVARRDREFSALTQLPVEMG